MRVPYNWLKNYIDFPYTPEELSHELTMAGMEVDGIEYLGEGLEDIIIGEIVRIRNHPNADKLVVCEVNTGDDILQIITGAPNVKEGARVPVAKVGTKLPTGMEIKEVELRGEPSYGMICSIDELGLSEERAPGIMILDDDADIGQKIVDYLDLNEYVLKLDLTPNYARCLGLIGISRELKALLPDKVINYPQIEFEEDKSENISDLVEIEVKDVELSPRYTGRIIKDVKIGPSPLWMQKRLQAAGIRPINNVVDITNYVLLEYNQPLHAFDYDKISGKKVIVRRAEKGEKLITLDDKERILDNEILVIADTEKALGLAGVMGGANSEVTNETTNIFLESAYFDPVNIRKTAKKLGIPSEASHRFERGVDIGKIVEASNRAAYLLQKYAGGRVIEGVIDIYPEEKPLLEIELNIELVNKILGLSLTADDVKNMLERLEFEIIDFNNISMVVRVPSYRVDVEREADLIEEVARIYGYNNIPVTRPESKQLGGKNFKQNLEDMTRDLMVASGLDEVITFSLSDEKLYNILKIPEGSSLRNFVKVKNPLNEAFSLMRTSLIPGIVEVLANNARRQIEEMAVFEQGNIFFNHGSGEKPVEKMMLAGGSMGYKKDIWNSGAPDFFYLKGVLENYFSKLGIKGIDYKPDKSEYLHPGRTARLVANSKEIGFIGELLPEIIDELDMKKGTTIFQLDFDRISGLVNLDRTYTPLPKYPAIERDLAVVVDEEINSSELHNKIINNGSGLLKDVKIFDLYQGNQIPAGKKSIAFKLLFQAEDKTLTDDEVNEIFERIVSILEENYQAEIRGN